jgi:hypothetical protein
MQAHSKELKQAANSKRMFKLLLTVGLLGVLGGACHSKQRLAASKTAAINKLETQLADSLRKYRHLTAFWQAGDSSGYALFGKEVNGRQVGIAAISDSVLLVFQEQNRQYKLVVRCSFPDDATDCEVTDLNGDDKEDVIVYGFGNMHGQRRPYVLLSDSTGLVHYRPDLGLYNIAYDAGKKRLLSFYTGGVNSLHSKEVRHWKGDSAELVAGAEYDMYSGSLELYQMCGNKKCHRKLYPETLRDTALRSYHEAVYDTALFDIVAYPY